MFSPFQPAFSQDTTTGNAKSIKGIARVMHYTRKDFNTDPQIWAMCQDKDGILYFGSNDGTLIFNGESWSKVSLPNNSSVRSLGVSREGVVYAGGFNEFGTIKKDSYGKYHYESLMNLLRAEDRNIENIWSIHEAQGHMVFRSYKLLIAIANNKAVTLPASVQYEYATVLDDKLYVNDDNAIKLVDLNSPELTRLITNEDLGQETLLALLSGYNNDGIIAITKEGSFYSLDVKDKKTAFLQRVIQANSSNRLTSAIKSSRSNYYLGTLTSKVIVLNSIGEKNISGEVFQDVQDNTVLNLFESKEGNIWVLLNNGIDCIDVSSPATRIFDNASISDALLDRDNLYIATNQGVFIAQINSHGRISRTDFKNVPGLEGQAWSLQKFEDHVLCSHDQGVIVFGKNDFRKLAGPRGIWKTMGIKGRPGQYLVCTYDGLWLMKYDNASGFKMLHRLEGFNESSRDIIQSDEPGVFWVCHGYKGVFRIKIDDEYRRVVSMEHFKDQNGLPSPYNINVFKWKDDFVFTTNHGIFIYNEAENKFQLHPELTTLFGTEKNVRKLIEAGEKTWFVHDDEAGYFESGKTPQLVKGLFLQLKGTLNQSMECILPVNKDNVLIGTRDGLYAFDLGYKVSDQNPKVIITGVRYHDGSSEVLCSLDAAKSSPQQFPYQTTGIRFDFAVPGFNDKNNIQYSCKLEGINRDWLSWHENSFIEFTLLPPGKYVLHVKARSLLGENASEATYHLSVLPVWYKTNLAYLIYTILSGVLIVVLIKLVQHRIEFVRNKTIAEEEKKRKVLQLELEHMKLAQEKEEIIKDKAILEEDVIFKSKELANYTMLLVKKRELLSEMQEQLTALKDMVKNDPARQGVRELQRKININLQNEEHIKVFEANFERVHHEFFAQLKQNFPDLTPKDLQLCGFVKMNLTNKEIASILNLSVRGVETARYRLRKRLGINHEQDMAEFLEKLYSSNEASPELKGP